MTAPPPDRPGIRALPGTARELALCGLAQHASQPPLVFFFGGGVV